MHFNFLFRIYIIISLSTAKPVKETFRESRDLTDLDPFYDIPSESNPLAISSGLLASSNLDLVDLAAASPPCDDQANADSSADLLFPQIWNSNTLTKRDPMQVANQVLPEQEIEEAPPSACPAKRPSSGPSSGPGSSPLVPEIPQGWPDWIKRCNDAFLVAGCCDGDQRLSKEIPHERPVPGRVYIDKDGCINGILFPFHAKSSRFA